MPGECSVLCDDSTCPVAVSTLASVGLAEALANQSPKGLCIVGKTETENIGVDKVIKNTTTNPMIHTMLLTGKEPKGHFTGGTLLALWENGVDEDMRIIGSPGKKPVLKNVTGDEVEIFREQVQIVDMIGCEDAYAIIKRIEELSKNTNKCGCQSCNETREVSPVSNTPVIEAEEPARVGMGKAGYLVIIPQSDRKVS